MQIYLINEQGGEFKFTELANRPLVINFTGGGLNIEQCGNFEQAIDQAVHTSAFVRRIIESEKADIQHMDIVSAVYDRKDESIIFDFNQQNKTNPEIEKLTDKLILSRMLDREGKKLPVERAAQNMGKVMLNGHCLGGLIVSEIEKILIKKLEKNNYAPKDIAKTVGNVNCFLSSVPVKVDNLPRFFNCKGFWNYSDRTLQGLEDKTGGLMNEIGELAGFCEKDKFIYSKNSYRWQVPQKFYQKIIRPENRQNCEMVIVNALETPSAEELKIHIKQRFGVSPTIYNEEFGIEMQSVDYFKWQKKILSGHDWNYILKAPNRKTSKFMRNLNHRLWSNFAELAEKTCRQSPTAALNKVSQRGGRL